jgi:hypothetical protein
MPLPRFRIRTLMIAAAVVAVAAAMALSVQAPATAQSALGVWAALYVVPVLVIVRRRVPFRRVARVSGRIMALGTLMAAGFAVLSFAMSGYVGLVGGFFLGLLSMGWLALFMAGLSTEDHDGTAEHLAPHVKSDGSRP